MQVYSNRNGVVLSLDVLEAQRFHEITASVPDESGLKGYAQMMENDVWDALDCQDAADYEFIDGEYQWNP